jgi:hypothetical protein
MTVLTFTAADVRASLREAGVEVGTRGRVSREQVTQALALRPATARALAGAAGLVLAERGRISAANFAAIAETVSI